MTIGGLLCDLQSRGLTLVTNGETLTTRGLKSSITPEVIALLKANKADLIAHLITAAEYPIHDDRCPSPKCRKLLKLRNYQLYWQEECPAGHFIRYVVSAGFVAEAGLVVDHRDEAACRQHWRTIKAWKNEYGDFICCRCWPPARPDLVRVWVEVIVEQQFGRYFGDANSLPSWAYADTGTD
jgi:hypothetical protein